MSLCLNNFLSLKTISYTVNQSKRQYHNSHLVYWNLWTCRFVKAVFLCECAPGFAKITKWFWQRCPCEYQWYMLSSERSSYVSHVLCMSNTFFLCVICLFFSLGFCKTSWFSLSWLFLQLGTLEPLLQKLTTEDEKQLKRILQRLHILAKVITNHTQPLLNDSCAHSETTII